MSGTPGQTLARMSFVKFTVLGTTFALARLTALGTTFALAALFEVLGFGGDTTAGDTGPQSVAGESQRGETGVAIDVLQCPAADVKRQRLFAFVVRSSDLKKGFFKSQLFQLDPLSLFQDPQNDSNQTERTPCRSLIGQQK